MPQLRHRPGDLLDDRYEVRKVLGSGAFGTVYGCQDTELEIPVAVKELHVMDERDGERNSALAEFRAEAIHLSKLRHPNIVSGHYEPQNGEWHICPVCGLDYDDGHCPKHGARLIELTSRHYLVMEYIAGPDLLQLAQARGGHIEWDELELTAIEVARALAYIHARGFVHRDIKPENIRLRADSNDAVLLDFGIAIQGEATDNRYGTRAQRQTQGGGTVGYAPAGGRERRTPDARSDVHAFGMTLYHLLTGLDPTDAEHERQMRAEEPRDFVPEMSDALNDFILDCIDYEPENRPQDGTELLERLEALDDEPQVAPAPPSSAPSTFQLAPQSPAPTHSSSPTPTAPVSMPLVFRSGHYVRDLNELAYMVDSQPREMGEKLREGEIEPFLQGLGEHELARRVADVRAQYRSHPAQALEMFAQAIGLPRPSLQMQPGTLHFGWVGPDSQRTAELQLVNTGRGLLFGSVRASHPALKTYGHWEGNRSKVSVSFDAHRLRPGLYQGDIEIRSSAGEFTVPFEARVSGPSWWPPFLTVVLCGAGGMMTGGALRVLPFTLMADRVPTLGWLSSPTQLPWWPKAPLFGLVLWLTLLCWTTIEATWKRSCSAWLTFGSLGVLLGIGGALLGVEALVSGDEYLKTFTFPWVGNFAPGGWIMAGAALGATLGALRRIKDWFSMRIFAVLLGVIATGVLVKLALLGAVENLR